MSNFRIKTCVLGEVSTNCYIVYNEGCEDAVIVDPADNGRCLAERCRELGVTPKHILLTHGHFDHIMAVPYLVQAFGARVIAAQAEAALLADPAMNLSQSWTGTPLSLHADKEAEDGEELLLLGLTWKVIATPGHTAGSLCYYIPQEEVLIAGDTLFAESCGRTDLPTGSADQLVASVLDKLLTLPEETFVYPGHGQPTTIGHEKKRNPLVFYRR